MAKDIQGFEALEQQKNDKYMIGITVMVILLVMTIGEFMLGEVGASSNGWIWVLILIGVFKAYMVVREYMHIGRVFSPDEEEH
jgi:TM2 domain-containing membrane protein YozV